MTAAPLLDRARAPWVTLAGVPATFQSPPSVVTAPDSQLCPPQWTGIVGLGGAGVVTTPTSRTTAIVREAVAGFTPADIVDVARWEAAVMVAEVLGPATLAYLDAAAFQPVDHPGVRPVPARHGSVAALLAAAPADEATESGIAAITSAAYVVGDGPDIAAAAGYRHWHGGAAHLCVLTAPDHRGRGMGRAVASAATADALAQGLLPQWRARRPASRRVARTLGYTELGNQLSLRIEG